LKFRINHAKFGYIDMVIHEFWIINLGNYINIYNYFMLTYIDIKLIY